MINYSLKLNKIKLLVYLGLYEYEIQNLQKIHLNLLIIFKKQPEACNSDNIKDTICYENINNILKSAVFKKRFKLIEYMGKYLLDSLIKNIDIKNIDIKIELFKYKPIDNILSASFCLEFLCNKI